MQTPPAATARLDAGGRRSVFAHNLPMQELLAGDQEPSPSRRRSHHRLIGFVLSVVIAA